MYAAQCHTSSVNSVSFAPHELGLVVAAASSDGSLSVLTHQPDGSWQTEKVRGWSPGLPSTITTHVKHAADCGALMDARVLGCAVCIPGMI